MSVDIAEMKPGKTYIVDFDDCCTIGHFVATFIRYTLDEDGDPEMAIFDNAHIDNLWASWSIQEFPVASQ